jgi:hypothetical protein
MRKDMGAPSLRAIALRHRRFRPSGRACFTSRRCALQSAIAGASK